MEKSLKVLMFSSDRNLLTEGSAVAARMKEYATLVGELHIVLLSDGKHGLKDSQLSPNLWVYPTNSAFNLMRPLDAAWVGKRIVFEKGFIRGQSLITAQDPFECGWAALQVKKRWRLPLEIQLHTDPSSPYFSGFQNRVRTFFGKGALKAADAVRVVSEDLKAKVAPLTKAPIAVLPIYVDRERVENAPISFDIHARYGLRFVILTASRLTPEKDLKTALEAVALARRSSGDVGLVIVGSGPEEGRLKALAKKLGVAQAVVFAGWQEDLASFYKTSNVFLQTSLFEGYGLSLVEAGLSALPAVATPTGIARELRDGEEIILVPPRRADLCAQALLDLMEHNGKREILRQNLKRALEGKLLPKSDYLRRLADAWQAVSARMIS